MIDRNTYFATLTGPSLCSAIFERIDDFYDVLNSSGRLSLYRRLANSYHLGYFRGGKLNQTGEQDEFTTMHANHFRNILQHLFVMTTAQRPTFEPHAVNTDYKSKAQTIVSKGVLDYYGRGPMGRTTDFSTEFGILFGETEAVVDWDASMGKPYMANPQDPGKFLMEGDVRFRNYTPINCIRDVTLTEASAMRWRVYRDFVNRHDLAARFPEAKLRINSIEMDNSVMSGRWLAPWSQKVGDTVPVYIFYHEKTPAVPNGAFALVIDTKGPLMSGGLPYDFFPGFRLAPSEMNGTPFGYSIAFDLLPIQEAIDILYSTVVTNQANFGVQNIQVPEGTNVTVEQLVNGLNLLKYQSQLGKIEPLNLVNTPPEIFNFIKQLEALMETLAGINSVTRGNPEASLKSGAALALVQSMAIQFNSGLQKAYAEHIQGVGTAVVQILAKFPKTKRIIEIAGKANRTYLKEFEAADLADISRVTVDLGNPLSRTTAGKVQMAEELLKNKLIETGDQYIQVLTTGSLEPLIESKQAELMLIASENEMMAEGKKPTVAVTDEHVLHIREHRCTLASPEARANPGVVQATTEHLTEHIKMLEQLSVSNPNLLIALGQTPVQAGPPAPPPGPGAPNAAPVKDPAADPAAAAAAKVGLPNMPKSPLTNAPASVAPPPPVV